MEPARSRLKGASLDDVAADGEERLVDFLNDVRTGENQVIVTAFQRLPSKILSGKVVTLDVRPHRAVVHEHSAVYFVQVTRLNLSICHA